VSTSKTCRWGILGAANIAQKNWQAIRHAENASLTAVASRSVERAQQFIDSCQSTVPHHPAPRAVGSYEALIAASDVDAIYIPLPTGIRKEWVIKAAQAGKHVLVEKPVGCNAADVAEMIAACNRNNVQFMDGVMFMHSARLSPLRDVLDDGTSVGRIRRISSAFTFCAPDEWVNSNIRASGELEPLGCLGDLGWYTIRFTLFALNYRMPLRVSGRMLTKARRPDSNSDVPMEFSAEMFFDHGVSATFYNSFITEKQQWANVSGTKGFLTVSDFVIPYFGCESAFEVHNDVFQQTGCQFDMEGHTRRISVRESSNNASTAQETNLFRKFSELVLSGKPDNSWADISLKTQQVMDACMESARQDGKIVELPSA
jgi:predicted dehydrogenase